MSVSARSSGKLSVVQVPDDCGNAPRRAIVRDFLVALYARNANDMTTALRDDVRWEIVGSQTRNGIDAVQEWLSTAASPTELSVDSIITHGRESCADGSIVFADGSITRYCHVILFAGATKTAKIKEIRSFYIDVSR